MEFLKELERSLAERYYGQNWDSASKNDMFLAILNAVSEAIENSKSDPSNLRLEKHG